MWTLASERGYLTVGDFLEDRYGQSVRVVIASLIWIGALFILAGQLLAGAAVFTVVAGLPKWAGVLIGGAAMTGYFSAGGLLSSAGVSVVQLVVKFTGFAIAIPILMKAAGGFDAITQTPDLPETFFDPLLHRRRDFRLHAAVDVGPQFHRLAGLDPEDLRRGERPRRATRRGRERDRADDLRVPAGVPRPRRPRVVPGHRGARSGPADAVAARPAGVARRAGAGRGVLRRSRRLRSDPVHAVDVALEGPLQAHRQSRRRRRIRCLRVARIAAFVGGSAGMLLAVFVVKEIIDALSCSIRSSAPRCWCRWSAACS